MNNGNGITSFIFMGDPQCSRISGSGADYSDWGRLLQRALTEMDKSNISCLSGHYERRPLLILGGDIVNRGNKNRSEEWEAFFEAAETPDEDILMATPVNGSAESIDRYADRFLNLGNGPVFHEKEFFSFDYGCCHFMFLDSSYMGNRHTEAFKFIGAWIRADLAANRKPVVFAVMHHPVYTLGTSFEDDVRAAAIRDNYLKLLFRYGVDVILCGHQHAYARSGNTGEDWPVTQIMGVSGTKFFAARDKSRMAVVKEFAPTATIFETDGETICLQTIDKDGSVVDEYSQNARLPQKRKCATCDNFSRCRGTGIFEKLEAEENARRYGDPLKPLHQEGIEVSACDNTAAVVFSDEELEGFEPVEVEYSVMRRGRLGYESFTGLRLCDLLESAGWKEKDDAGTSLILTNSKGHQKLLPLQDVLHAWRFADASTPVPALITREEGSWRIVFGQQRADEYNGRGWARDIRQIDIYA